VVAAEVRTQEDAKKLADELSGNAPGKAGSNPVCNLFRQAEIAKYLGVDIGPAENRNVPNGIGCSWTTKDYESWVGISMYGVALPGLPKRAMSLPAFGAKGYVLRHVDSWETGPDDGNQGIVVQVYGETATEVAATSILQERSSAEGTNKLLMVLHKGHETISASYSGVVRQECCWHETEMAWKDDARC